MRAEHLRWWVRLDSRKLIDLRETLDETKLMFDLSTLLSAVVLGFLQLGFRAVFFECYLDSKKD